MGILRIDHPDIIDFITSKKDTSKLNNFNISVAITEDFMEHALKNEDYPLINPRNNEIVKYLNAKEVFDLIVETAWSSGEPELSLSTESTSSILYLKPEKSKRPTLAESSLWSHTNHAT
jgi:Ribonucleotide reductase, alpha subunit